MSLPLLIACLAASIVINLIVNGLWLWIAVRMAGAKTAGLVRAVLVALAMAAALVLAGRLALAIHPALVLLALPGAIALGVWLTRRAFALSRWRTVGAWAGTFAVVVITNVALAFAIRAVWLIAFVVSSASMEPTLKIGDRFVVDRTLAPQRWDCLVFHPASSPRQAWVKRIVGLPGETVAMRGEALLINGQEIPVAPVYSGHRFDAMDHDPRLSPQLPHRGTGDGPVTLGPDEFFVVGDTVERSLDSRTWNQNYGPTVHPGAVPRSAVVGVVRGVYAPLEHWRVFR
jgi:signal peptidase I